METLLPPAPSEATRRGFFMLEKKSKKTYCRLLTIGKNDLSLYHIQTGAAPAKTRPKFIMDLLETIWQIARENPKGFTITIPDCKPVRSGWCIGHKATQNSFGKKGLKRVIEHSLETTKVVGGWKGYGGKYYFDTVIIEADAAKALDLKEEHDQISIYHLDTGRIL